MKCFRHGDILLIPVEENNLKKPDLNGLKVRKNKIVEYGEISGHAHQIQGHATVYENKEGMATVVIIEETSKITHEEHNEIELIPGYYNVIRQREYNPYEEAIRYVQD